MAKKKTQSNDDAAVREAQIALCLTGYYDGLIDGIAGPKTEAAARLFQQRHEIEEKEALGPETRDALRHSALGVTEALAAGVLPDLNLALFNLGDGDAASPLAGLDDLLNTIKRLIEILETILKSDLLRRVLEGLGVEIPDLRTLKRIIKALEDIKHILRDILKLFDDVKNGRKTLLEIIGDIIDLLKRIVDILVELGWIDRATGRGIKLFLDGIASNAEGLKDLSDGKIVEGLDKIFHDIRKIVEALQQLGLITPEQRASVDKIMQGLALIKHGIADFAAGNEVTGLCKILEGLKKVLEGLKELGIIKD